VKAKTGGKSCPFNRLYWHFMIENEAQLAKNPRMAMPYRTLSKMSDERRAEITREARAFLDHMDNDGAVPHQKRLDF
jgi:deoxyribodipyrimidine photolyase-related protein